MNRTYLGSIGALGNELVVGCPAEIIEPGS